MLASSTEDAAEALRRWGQTGFEYKLDGARIQVHKGGDEIQIFTRQSQDVTERLPELVEWARALPVREAILDGEAIALRRDGRPQPFQTTMRRLGRIKNVETLRQEIPISPFMFDVLYIDGQPLVARAYEDRIRALTEVESSGHEGLMAKELLAPYRAGQRGPHWLKWKEASTLDLVILAAEWGDGRRTGWLSNLHLGARDSESGHFVMLGKTFKGLTDQMLTWQTERLLSLETHRDAVAVYVTPLLVAEIAFSDIQHSPRYPGGLALRFARVKRYRPDKPADQADTIQTVTALFDGQRVECA
jgi:DNA ligase 1